MLWHSVVFSQLEFRVVVYQRSYHRLKLIFLRFLEREKKGGRGSQASSLRITKRKLDWWREMPLHTLWCRVTLPQRQKYWIKSWCPAFNLIAHEPVYLTTATRLLGKGKLCKKKRPVYALKGEDKNIFHIVCTFLSGSHCEPGCT